MRNVVRAGVALAVVLVLVTGAYAKKGRHAVHGRVTAVKLNKDGTGSITVHIRNRKQNTEEDRTFQVGSGTKFQAVTVKGKGKANRETSAATAADVQTGSHVIVVSAAGGNQAAMVAVVKRLKPNKQ